MTRRKRPLPPDQRPAPPALTLPQAIAAPSMLANHLRQVADALDAVDVAVKALNSLGLLSGPFSVPSLPMLPTSSPTDRPSEPNQKSTKSAPSPTSRASRPPQFSPATSAASPLAGAESIPDGSKPSGCSDGPSPPSQVAIGSKKAAIEAIFRQHPNAKSSWVAKQVGAGESHAMKIRAALLKAGEITLDAPTPSVREGETEPAAEQSNESSEEEDGSPERLTEKFRPKSLDELVGQSCLGFLHSFVVRPHSACLLFTGSGGVGKTSAALSIASALGCEDEMSGLLVVPCSSLGIERATEIFQSRLQLRPLAGRGWRVLILEELEWLSPQTARFLKVALESRLPDRCVVIATSNDVSGLDGSLVQRFAEHRFESGSSFRAACRERLRTIWLRETGGRELPVEVLRAGDVSAGQFSMRVALLRLGELARCVRSRRQTGGTGDGQSRNGSAVERDVRSAGLVAGDCVPAG